MNRAIVLFSGGQDSTYCLAWARKAGFTTHALIIDYGQRHAEAEINAARAITFLMGISHEVIHLPRDILAGRSPLVDPETPLEQYASYEEMESVIGSRIELTSVPLRNMLFATLAANRAAVAGPDTCVVLGVCKADASNYPDCRPEFLEALEVTTLRGLQQGEAGRKLIFAAPLLDKSKAAIIKEMYSWGMVGDTKVDGSAAALWAFTQTSYAGDYPPMDRNHANVLREQGFREARLPDPLILRAASEGLMPLPDEPHYRDENLNATIINAVNRLREKLL